MDIPDALKYWTAAEIAACLNFRSPACAKRLKDFFGHPPRQGFEHDKAIHFWDKLTSEDQQTISGAYTSERDVWQRT